MVHRYSEPFGYSFNTSIDPGRYDACRTGSSYLLASAWVESSHSRPTAFDPELPFAEDSYRPDAVIAFLHVDGTKKCL